MTGATMDESDLALQRKAIESLIRDAALWKKKRDRDVRATRLTQFSLNKNFLKNLLTRNESFNDRLKSYKEAKSKRPQRDENEASTSKDSSKKIIHESLRIGSEESFRIVNKKNKKRRRSSSSESLTSDDSSTSTTSDSSIEVIIAKKRKRKRKGKSSKHSRKRRSPSSSSSYEMLRKHLKKSFGSKYLKLPSQSKSKKAKGTLELSSNIHKIQSTDSEVSAGENNTIEDKLLTSHQNESDITLPKELIEREQTEGNRQLTECQSKEFGPRVMETISSTESKDPTKYKNSNFDGRENENKKQACTKAIISEETAKIDNMQLIATSSEDINKKIESEKLSQSKDKIHSENKISKSRRKSSHRKSSTIKEKLVEKSHKSIESQEIEKQKKTKTKVDLYSDDDNVFLKIVPITEKEKILNKKLKDDSPKKSNEQNKDEDKTSQSYQNNEANNSLEKANKVNQELHDKKHKSKHVEEKKESVFIKDTSPPGEVKIKEKVGTSLDKLNTIPKEETINLNEISLPDVSESTKVSFSLSAKQNKTVKKPTEFQHEVETPDRSEKYRSPSRSVKTRNKTKKKPKKRKSKRRSLSSVEMKSPKPDIKKRISRSRSKHSYSARDDSSRSNSRHRDLSRSISKYSRRDSRTPLSDYSYSRSKYKSYTRSRSRSDRSYRRYSSSSRDSRSYSRDSRKKYRSSSHSSYSSRSRHNSRSSYRDSRSSSRHRSRKYRDRSSSSRSRRRRSISFSCVYTDPEKARKYYRRSPSSSSSSSRHSYGKYKRK